MTSMPKFSVRYLIYRKKRQKLKQFGVNVPSFSVKCNRLHLKHQQPLTRILPRGEKIEILYLMTLQRMMCSFSPRLRPAAAAPPSAGAPVLGRSWSRRSFPLTCHAKPPREGAAAVYRHFAAYSYPACSVAACPFDTGQPASLPPMRCAHLPQYGSLSSVIMVSSVSGLRTP